MFFTNVVTVTAIVLGLAHAQIEVDARFYRTASDSGAVGWDTADFYLNAHGMGPRITGTFYSRKNTNDCSVPLCTNLDAAQCCQPELLNALSGGKYIDRNDDITYSKQISLNAGTHKGCVETDSYVYKAFNGHVYYVKKSNASLSTSIESLWSLREYDLLKEFIIRHADLIREERT
ncbi:hypothetical protein CABS01_14084 [Colletotrichum abscissum]|uniref:Secreted protein n=1 Tax=Colletotrichum abscissum TaxID=1671311 RepID=A0A9P9XBD8_9PEZI|nr:uncharacterized protein CABS01_14084 [Colletotrichum abscissum]KAI3545704.1 hypothetical protein CABS02_09242 [Colletotrichum abscissum]KAK1482386.1 hypothetical protein CABS01_14084 [Colletotrichum abscissum]